VKRKGPARECPASAEHTQPQSAYRRGAHAQLGRGGIMLTVAPENIAELKQGYHTNLEVCDPVVRYGDAHGLEPVTYVALILERYEHYLEFVE
jgi:hypothetical protein